MKKNSKAIGGDYERVIARKLSDWLQGEIGGDLICWRASHSGSVGTNLKKKGIAGKNVSGDFQCLDSKYEYFFNIFHCDSKSLGNVNLMLINNKNQKSNQLLNEWKKVYNDSGKNKIPLMFVKARNDRSIPEFVMIPLSCYLIDKDEKEFYNFPYYKIEFENKYSCYLILQDDFFKNIIPKNLYEINKFLISSI